MGYGSQQMQQYIAREGFNLKIWIPVIVITISTIGAIIVAVIKRRK